MVIQRPLVRLAKTTRHVARGAVAEIKMTNKVNADYETLQYPLRKINT
jgi:hypothetical protein